MANAGFSVGTFTGGGTFLVESLSGTLTPVGVVAWGGSGTATRVVPTAAGALPVTLYAGTLNAGTVTVANTGTVVGTVSVSTIAAGTVAISTIAAGTVVATNTVLSVVGGGAEATAQRVTIASDSTGVLSVDDNGASLTVDGTVTANLSATDNAVLDAIEVDTTTIAGAVKAEDAAHTTGDTGIMSLAVRKDSGAAIAGTDGDYSPLQVDASGALRVTGGGGGTEYVVDAAAPAAPTGTASLMERDDALSALTEIEGDWTNMRSTSTGALWTAVSGTVTVDGSGVTQPVSGTVTANLSATDNAVLDAIEADTTTIAGAVAGTEMQVDVITMPTVTVDSELPAAAALADNTANPTVPAVGSFGMFYDGTTWDRAPGTSADGALVNLGANNDVTVTGTVTANLSATDNAVLDAIEVDTTTIAGAVSGTEMQVDVVAALPAGTNNIGDVDVLSVPAPLSTTGGGTEATALRVTLASDSTGVVSVDDNGASLTVDGTVAISTIAAGTVVSDQRVGAGKTLQFGTVNLTSGSVSLVNPGSGTTAYIVGMTLTAGTAGVIQFLQGAGAAALSGPIHVDQYGGFVDRGRISEPIMKSAAGSQVYLSITSGIGTIGGFYSYFTEA